MKSPIVELQWKKEKVCYLKIGTWLHHFLFDILYKA